ncbi:DUF4097 family beta strand repeat-containing protein [Nocardia alni]|uniref:DUF4097 family beta strand repeat-containing protein n=1 Tax=Nocardia alni TaxID=2815723 RepID=UPI001C21DBD9|nr:DUF4097 family beta strand repeat-containing protein [Nocardia alni]
MREFDTPEPISVVVDAYVGHIGIIATDRAVTVVDVRADNQNRSLDVEVVEQTRVEYSAGRLRVNTPRPLPSERAVSRDYGAIEVVIEVPSGSRVQADTAMGTIRTTGRLGDCRLTSSLGDIHVDTAGALELSTTMGTISVQQAHGRVQIHTGTGEVRIQRIDGPAEIDHSNGATTIDLVTDDLRVESANGDITVGRAESRVTARTDVGSIRVDEVARGSVCVETGMGQLEIGIRPGIAAALDLHTPFGSVRNELDAAQLPEVSGKNTEVRARTSAGDIIVRRSA